MNVLVAEDNTVNQLLIRAYLRKLGWEYEIVENGLWAVDSCRNGNFDAVLMDINMPELNGIEATEKIRAFDSEIPVIALTAYNDEMNRTRCAIAGMNGLIEKPVSLHMLKDVMSNLVAREN